MHETTRPHSGAVSGPSSGQSSGQQSGPLSRPAARRLAAATQKVNKAKREGPKATVEAMRASLLSAVKINPSQTVINEVADYALAKIHELYRDADRSGADSDRW